MKFNLKNRPRGHEGAMGYNSFDYQAVKEWFEGFEKELRAKIEKDKRKLGADLAYYIDAREILGE